jgi:hypothetical protein
MTTAVQQNSPAPRLTPEEIRRETALSLVADLLDRALCMLPGDLQISLVQIYDSGLLAADLDFHKQVRNLADEAEAILNRLHKTYPHCQHGSAHHLLRKENMTLARMVDLFRQEQFWTRRDRESFIDSEVTLADLYKLYRKVEFLRCLVDAEHADGGFSADRHAAPTCEPNPYESLF